MASIHRAIPQILVDSLDDALSYYQERLGFTCDFVHGGFYASISRDGAVIHLKLPPKVEGGPERFRFDEQLDAFLPVSGAQELHDEFVRRGARIVKSLELRPWGQRDFYVEDPDGYILCFSEAV
jgi:catechol 2,3-dioxygenase-like lactoylglutathione lyase family enzyme